MNIGILLISLCLGYLVFLQANREKNQTRQFGRIVAIVVITLSLVGMLCALKHRICKNGCPIQAAMCKMSSRSCPMGSR